MVGDPKGPSDTHIDLNLSILTFQMHANCPLEDGVVVGGHIETIPAYWDGFWKHWLTHNGVKQWFEPETGAYKIPPDNPDLPNACQWPI